MACNKYSRGNIGIIMCQHFILQGAIICTQNLFSHFQLKKYSLPHIDDDLLFPFSLLFDEKVGFVFFEGSHNEMQGLVIIFHRNKDLLILAFYPTSH